MVSPIPRLIIFALGRFSTCDRLRFAICKRFIGDVAASAGHPDMAWDNQHGQLDMRSNCMHVQVKLASEAKRHLWKEVAGLQLVQVRVLVEPCGLLCRHTRSGISVVISLEARNAYTIRTHALGSLECMPATCGRLHCGCALHMLPLSG